MRGVEEVDRVVVLEIEDTRDCLMVARRANINQRMMRIFSVNVVAFYMPEGGCGRVQGMTKVPAIAARLSCPLRAVIMLSKIRWQCLEYSRKHRHQKKETSFVQRSSKTIIYKRSHWLITAKPRKECRRGSKFVTDIALPTAQQSRVLAMALVFFLFS